MVWDGRPPQARTWDAHAGGNACNGAGGHPCLAGVGEAVDEADDGGAVGQPQGQGRAADAAQSLHAALQELRGPERRGTLGQTPSRND
jgi:hypothetical protein